MPNPNDHAAARAYVEQHANQLSWHRMRFPHFAPPLDNADHCNFPMLIALSDLLADADEAVRLREQQVRILVHYRGLLADAEKRRRVETERLRQTIKKWAVEWSGLLAELDAIRQQGTTSRAEETQAGAIQQAMETDEDDHQICVDCGNEMELVRPGKWQCVTCEEREAAAIHAICPNYAEETQAGGAGQATEEMQPDESA